MKTVSKFLCVIVIVFLLIAIVVLPVLADTPDVSTDQAPGQTALVKQDASVDEIDPLTSLPVEAISLTIFTTGIVAVMKKLGLKGKTLTVSSLIWGMALGILYKCAVAMPVTFANWFFAGLLGLLCGLIATGIYDAYGNKVVDSAG